jgi:hypothetical protein
MARKSVKPDRPELQLGDVFSVLSVRRGEGDHNNFGRQLLRKKFIMLKDDALCLVSLGYPYYDNKIDASLLTRCNIRVLGTTRTGEDHWHLGRGIVAVFGGQALLRVRLDHLVAVNFVQEPDPEPPTFALTFAASGLWASSVSYLKERPEGAFTVGDVSILSGGKFLGRPTQSELYVLPRSVPQGGTVYFRCTTSDLGLNRRSRAGLRRQRGGRLMHLCRELDNGHILYDIFEELLVQSPDPLKDF